MNKKQILFLSFLFLTIFVCSSLQAQTVTVTPTEYPDALTNPFMGFRTDGMGNWKAKPYRTIARHYIHWNEINNSTTDGVQKIIDFCNTQWAGCEAANVKIIPRVILDWSGGEYWPSYLTKNDYTSQKTRDAVVKMIAMLGQAWDNDPRVAWVQTGIIGKWGEQESPENVNQANVAPDNSTWASIMGQAFAAAFPHKLQLVRNQQYWSQPMGVYWDSFAHEGQYSGSWTNIKNANANGRYLVAPVEGEVAYNWGDVSHFGSSPDATLSNATLYNYVINAIKQLHCSGLGWISSYTVGSSTATGANLMQKVFGYRFAITQFQCSARTEPGSTLTMSAKIKNTGSAVMFENWPVAFVLINESTRQIVYQSVISGTDIRNWKPGSNYDWDPVSNPNGSKVYLTPAVENTISASIPIPSNIAPSQYLAGLTILDPTTQKPGVFFAVNNFFKESQSQPLCRIGIGADATNNIVTGPFDNPVANDTRYYGVIPPTTYTITASAGSNGSISPSGSVLVNSGANQSFTITPSNGYQVDVVTVDGVGQGSITSYTFNNVTANHTISATFKVKTVTQYTITASAGSNGSISPSGSVLVDSAASKTFAISANSGYQVDVVTVDGASQGSITSYTFTNVTANHTIDATFKVAPPSTNVTLLGTWVKGTTHAKELGSNRALVVMLYGEGSGNISASTVTYGGQTMTKVIEKAYLNSAYSYTGAFVLNEAGVAAATSGTIAVTWSTAPSTGSDMTSAFYSNVNQSSLIGASASNGLAGTTITTSALSNSAGDMVLVGGTAGNNGTYTINNGFTRGIPETSASFGDITSAYKLATGVNETPSLTMSASMRQTIVGFVLKKSVGTITTFTLTTNATNGSVSPSGGVYDSASVVTLTPTPSAGYQFSSWSGDLTGNANPGSITMDANKVVTANFVPINYTLTVNAVNGTVALNPPGGTYTAGTVVTLTPTANPGYVFSNWSDDLTGNANPGSITMNSNKNVTANFSVDLGGGDVSLIGTWVQGATHAKEVGSNRALVVMLYGEGSGNISASTVTYGGQAMTKVIEKAYLNSAYSYTGAFVLNESGVAAATSGTIAVTWSVAPSTGSAMTSAFYSNVNQSTLTGASASNGLAGATITTSALANNAGDMVLVGGTAANNGTYTINNGFTRGIPETTGGFGDITSAYKSATGAAETPSLTMSASMRQTIVGFVLKKSGLSKSSQEMNDEAEVILPTSTQLMQNYPNPFNPETTIPYQLTEPSHAKITIHNTLGQEINKLVDRDQAAGHYSVRWNGRDVNGNKVASGIYFYMLETNNAVFTKKLVLLQ